MSQSPRPESGSARRLCVVLHPSDGGADSGLLKALGKRNLRVVSSSDPHDALARVCNDARAGYKSILVFDGDEPRTHSERLASAMERFAPEGVCWNHLPGANPPIQPVVGPLGGAIDAAIEPTTKPAPKPAPKPAELPAIGKPAPALRLTEEPRSAPKRAPVSAKDVLDADELDALLASEMPPKKKDGV